MLLHTMRIEFFVWIVYHNTCISPVCRTRYISSTTAHIHAGGAAYALSLILLEGRRLEDRSKLLTPLGPVLESFVSWMTSRLQQSTSASTASRALAVLTPSLTVLVVDSKARTLFDDAGGIGAYFRAIDLLSLPFLSARLFGSSPHLLELNRIGYLARHLKVRQQSATSYSDDSTSRGAAGGASSQKLYELCYCIWLLSYDCDSNERIRNHFYRDGAVAALVDLVAAKPREKVVRLALASLRNLAVCREDADATVIRDSLSKRTICGKTFLQEMVGCGLPKFIGLMREREWKDADLVDGT